MDLKLLQIGAPKSGNYWLYTIIQHIYEIKGVPSRSFIKNQPVYQKARFWDLSNSRQAGIDMMDIEDRQCYYRISSVVREPIADLENYVNETNHVWTHSEVCDNTQFVLKHFNKLVYIYRDPRDVAVSAARFAFTPYMLKYYPHGERSFESYLANHFPEMIHRWIWHVTDYLLFKEDFPVHFIAYENLLGNFERTVFDLVRYLGFEFSEKEMDELKQPVSFQEMRKKDPTHVKKGKRMQWIHVLNNSQKESVVEMAGDLLTLLNYPTDDKSSLPVNANKLHLEAIKHTREKLKQPAFSA